MTSKFALLLASTDTTAQGELTLIYRNDLYMSANHATGNALATRYRIEASLTSTNLSGTYTAQIGIPFEHTVPASARTQNQDIRLQP